MRHFTPRTESFPPGAFQDWAPSLPQAAVSSPLRQKPVMLLEEIPTLLPQKWSFRGNLLWCSSLSFRSLPRFRA